MRKINKWVTDHDQFWVLYLLLIVGLPASMVTACVDTCIEVYAGFKYDWNTLTRQIKFYRKSKT